MDANEFRCALCEGIFTKGWSDDEAAAECATVFGEVASDDAAISCDDCYNDLMGRVALSARNQFDYRHKLASQIMAGFDAYTMREGR